MTKVINNSSVLDIECNGVPSMSVCAEIQLPFLDEGSLIGIIDNCSSANFP